MSKKSKLEAKLKRAKKKTTTKKGESKRSTREKATSKKLISKGTSKSRRREPEMDGIINKGYKSVKENEKRIQLAKEQSGLRIFRTWIPNGETKTYRFLNEEPITYMEHRLNNPGRRPEFITCIGQDCPLCAIADGNRIGNARFVGMYLVIERDEYTVQNGPNKGKTFKDQPRLFVEGQTVLSQLSYLSNKRGVTSRDYDIHRSERTRTFDGNDKSPLSKEDKRTIKKLLEDHEVDSIDELLYNQVAMQTYSQEELEDRFGEEGEESSIDSKLRNF